MKKICASSVFAFIIFLAACGSETKKNEQSADTTKLAQDDSNDPNFYDPKRGEGKFSSENVVLTALDQKMATAGEGIAGTKCTSCHKLTEERLVGPGWKGVTERRTAYWIMNFITNPDPMIDKDPEVQSQLELCLVRMPNQNLEDDEARAVVEFMRKNDGVN